MTAINAYAVREPGGAFAPFRYEAGPLGSDEVEIDVVHCGICHSDLSMAQNEWGMTTYPLVPGHEVIGQVAATGAGVATFEIGQWVGLGWQSGYCKTCGACLSGDHNLCDTVESTIIGRHGGFADKVRADKTAVARLPEGVDPAVAGPLLCAGITVFAPLLAFGVRPTDRVAVIGIGGLGHLALQFYRAWGCRVTAFTSSGAKTEEALALGAHDTVNSRDPEAIAAAAGRFDFVLSTVSASLDWNAYVATLRPKGRLHFVGVTTEPLSLSLFPLLVGQRSVSSSPVGGPSAMAAMLDFARRHDIRPMTETYAFDDVNAAMARLESGEARYRVVLSRV